jgi:SAM-dependent methyltransferase
MAALTLAAAPLKKGRTTTVQIPDDERPRYAIKTLDVAEEAQTPCACFVVPRGREHEFVFSSDEGLKQVAGSAKCARLLVVNLDPQRAGHSYGDVRAVQRELEPLIKDLAPPGAGTVPVMTAGNDLGRRDVVATGAMDSGDAYVVEQVLDGSRTLRRLLFRSNPRSIQTEVAISKVKPPKSSNGKKKKSKAKTQWRVDGADVRSAYHRAILAAVATSRLDHTGVEDVVLVGLGGGALATALQALVPSVNIRVVELDGAVVDVAERWFGFSRAGVDVTVGDGLAAFDDVSEADVVVIDVDAKDASLGMSCPPAAFLAPAYLQKVKRVLRPGGVCVVNIVARAEKAFSKAMVDLRAVFDDIRICDPTDDDVNRVVVARVGSPPDRAAWRARLRSWCADGDPLGLEALLDRFDQAVFNVDTEALDACD